MFLSFLFTPWVLLALPVLYFLLPYLRNFQIQDVPGPFLAKFTNLWYLYECRLCRRYMTVHKLHEKYGKLVRVQPNQVSIADPTAIPVVYGHGTGFLKSDYYDAFVSIHRGLFNTRDRAEHTRKRKTVSHTFSTKSVGQFEQYIHHNLEQLASQWDSKSKLAKQDPRSNGYYKFDALHWFNYVAFDIIGDLAFGAPFGMLEKGADVAEVRMTPDAPPTAAPAIEVLNRRGEVSNAIGTMSWIKPYAKYIPDPFFYKGVEAVQNLAGIAISRVNERLAAAERGEITRTDLLARLMEGKDESGNPLGREELTAEALTQLIAGSDTTSNTSCALLFHCLTRPEVVKKLQAELDKALPTDEVPMYEQVKDLKYLDMVIQETLRIHSTSSQGLPRVVPPGPGVDLAGHHFPQGVVLSVPAYTMHHSKEIWGPDADEYRPERWEKLTDMQKQAFIPFSYGPRACVGRNVAEMELALIVATVFRRYEFELYQDHLETREGFLPFEVDAKDAITFAELFSSIPPPIRRLITKTLSVGVHIANIFILLAALAGCAAAYCLALAWIYTLRVQSRLLVLNAALLRTAFHQTAPDQDVRVQPPAAQTVPQDVRPAEDACQDQTQPKFNKATAAPLTRGTGQPQEEVLRETNLAGTGNVAHDGMGKSPDKDYLSLRRQVEQDVALNGATVGRSVPLGTHQAPVSWPEGGPLSQANLPNDQFTRLTEVDDNADAHNEWLERVDATPPSAVFDAEPPLKASGLRNVDATPSLHGSAEALSAARAFKNGATKAGNKDRGFGHPKSRSATSHTSNTSTARNDRKTAQFIGSVRSNAGRANAPPGLPRAAASTIRPSSATWLLPGQLPPHMLAAKEARERRSGIQHAKDTDKLTAKAILPPPPAVASKNRYDALSQDSLTSEPTAMSSASFTLTEESSIENEQMRSMESGLHFDSYEELLPEVLSKNNTSFERDPKEDSRIFSIETLKSFDTPLARDSLEDSACALCQRSLLQPSSVQKDVCSNCCSVIDTIDDARAVIEDYNLHDQRQSFKGVPKHDKQWIAPSKETENTFTQETLPSSPSEKTSSSLSPKAPPFFVPSRKQSNVTATGSKSGLQHPTVGAPSCMTSMAGIMQLGEMDLSVHHGVPDAMVSPSAQHQSPYGDLVTSLEASFTTRPISQAIPASLTTRSSSQAIPIIAPVSSEPDSRLGLRPIPKTSVDVAIAHLENYTTSDGCANSFQGATGGQESPATKSLSPSVALNSETGRKHPDSVARSAQHRGTENEPVVRGLTMQDHAVSGFRKELEDPLISFQSSEEILRPEDTHSQFKHILGESTGSAETVGPGNDRLNTAEDAADTESEPQGDQCETISASREPSKNKSTNKIAQKERRQRRKILRDELLMAWCTRERARKRVAGGFSLERYKTLEDATRAYHAKREELQKASPEGELNEDDALMFPKMPVNDVSSPQRWPRGANETLRAQQEQARQSEEKEESLDPAAASSSDEDLSELKQQALKALQNFRNAEASVKYPAPQGRAKMRQLKEDARAKLKRARQWYVRKRKEVVDKDPDDPSLVDELPWVAEHV
ncbi:Benzoate [Hortaea werneckii]|nr:Benzoate [Hortaea werneckii]KAI6973131.1 Benzoate [Hortaea werneckii]KAI7043154.1 Benzoate [Hortaea werneckii]KAI7077881.1 Benzoate [Hortaea werneckii]KAI7134926.1 Benzoate [Hortaea werneckii]